jgi:hypothetical protein
MTGNRNNNSADPRPLGNDCRDYVNQPISAIDVHDRPFITDEVADEIVAELREIENAAHE